LERDSAERIKEVLMGIDYSKISNKISGLLRALDGLDLSCSTDKELSEAELPFLKDHMCATYVDFYRQ